MRVRNIVQACSDRGIKFLTLFAFSTENWQRPPSEVAALLMILRLYLRTEAKYMSAAGVRFKVIGDVSQFDQRIQALIREAEADTAHNNTITLTIAASYGGRWDMLQAINAWQLEHPGETAIALNEASLTPYLSTAYAPAPDILIRTGGETRISNFMLWQIAYSELSFIDTLWPDFGEDDLDAVLASYAKRERRFGGNSSPNWKNA
jgi:undecaprenyl diphosphate synthase